METDNGPKTDPHEIWFTKTDSVKVTNEKPPTSKLVRTLNRGKTLKVIVKSGSRFQIELDDGKIGWASKSKLTQHNLSNQSKSFESLNTLTEQSNIIVEESRTGGSIRG